MLLFNLLILFLVIVLSYVFKLSETKKYDTQLVFILLTFTILVLYKTLNYIYNKRESSNAIKVIAEKFSSNENIFNDFISETLSDREKILSLEKELKQYKEVYDTNNILNNNLENKIKYAEDAIAKLSDEYVVDLENSNPGGDNLQINLEASEEGIRSTESPDILTNRIDTNSVKNAILAFLGTVSNEISV